MSRDRTIVPSAAQATSAWQKVKGQAAVFAFVFALPVLCFAVDASLPGIVTQTIPIVAWSATAFGMAAFALSTLRLPAFASGLVTGATAGGAMFAAGVFLMLLPLTLIALFAGIGLLGLVPAGTSRIFAKRALKLYNDRPLLNRRWMTGAGFGTFLYVAIPAGLQLTYDSHMDRLILALKTTDQTEGREALSALVQSTLCFDRCKSAVCFIYTANERDYSANERDLVAKIIGGDPAAKCNALAD